MLPTASSSPGLARGYSLALLSSVVLSTTGVLIRHLTQTYGLPALVLAFWRDAFAGLGLLVALAVGFPRLLRVRRRDLSFLALFGLTLAVFNALWTLAVALNGAAVSTVLVYSSTAFTALLGRWLLGERLHLARAAAIGLCLAGCTMAAGALAPQAWTVNALGIVTGLASGLLYAIYTLMGKAAARRGLNAWTTLTYAFGAAAACLLVFNLAGIGAGGRLPGAAAQLADFLWLHNAAGWLTLITLALGPTLLGFGLYNLSLAVLPSNLANLILTTEPAFTAAIAFFALGERLDTVQLAGSVLILLAVLFLRLHEGRREKTTRLAGGLPFPAGE